MADYFSPHSQTPSENDDDDGGDRSKKQLLCFQQVVVGASANSGDSSDRSASGRKPRGRPPGSRNKPRAPVIVTKENPSAMHPIFLEISPNSDILAAVFDFARRRRAGISVLAGAGPVTDVVLRHPTVATSTVSLGGRFEILSLTGSFMPGSSSAARPFVISVAGPQGQVVGGVVVGPLMSAGMVTLTAASFLSPEIYRLPIVSGGDQDEEEQMRSTVKEEGINGGGSAVGPTSVTSGGRQQQQNEMVLWASPAVAGMPRAPPPHSHRPPPPPPPHY